MFSFWSNWNFCKLIFSWGILKFTVLVVFVISAVFNFEEIGIFDDDEDEDEDRDGDDDEDSYEDDDDKDEDEDSYEDDDDEDEDEDSYQEGNEDDNEDAWCTTILIIQKVET